MRVLVAVKLTLLLILLMTGCTNSQTNTISPTDSTPTYLIQIEREGTERVSAETSNPVLDNCGGSGDLTQTIRRGRSTTVVINLTYSATVEAGFDAVVKAQLGVEFSIQEGETLSSSNDITVTIAPGTKVRYQVQWYETWDTGNVSVPSLGLTIPYRIRRGYDADTTSEDEPCNDITAQIIETDTSTPIITLTHTPTNIPSAYIPQLMRGTEKAII